MVPNAGQLPAAGTKGLAPIHDGQTATQNGTRRKLSATKWPAHDCVRQRETSIASYRKRNDAVVPVRRQRRQRQVDGAGSPELWIDRASSETVCAECCIIDTVVLYIYHSLKLTLCEDFSRFSAL
jgi:hypothetical protein